MNFQDLNKIEKPDFYIDLAMRRSREKAKLIRGSKLRGGRMEKSKYIETRKIEIIKDTIVNHLGTILKSYPSIDQLPEFYLELIKCTLDYAQLKKSLGALNWCVKQMDQFFRIYASKINKTNEMEKINQFRREFYGRFASFIKQIRKELLYLEVARRVMKDYPTIKTSMPSVAIAGFPNIGKTTLLYKLTGSKPEISNYSFTTKGVNISYYRVDDKRIQMLDTPGTLNRFNKMNDIERVAYLAIKLVAEKVIYIFDLTEPYPLKDQEQLYRELKKMDKEIICYLSKTDIIEDKGKIAKFAKKYNCVDLEGLKKILIENFVEKEICVE